MKIGAIMPIGEGEIAGRTASYQELRAVARAAEAGGPGATLGHQHPPLPLSPMALAPKTPADLALFAASRGYVEPIAPARCTITVSDPSRVAEQR